MKLELAIILEIGCDDGSPRSTLQRRGRRASSSTQAHQNRRTAFSWDNVWSQSKSTCDLLLCYTDKHKLIPAGLQPHSLRLWYQTPYQILPSIHQAILRRQSQQTWPILCRSRMIHCMTKPVKRLLAALQSLSVLSCWASRVFSRKGSHNRVSLGATS